jgi:hypothetical protein
VIKNKDKIIVDREKKTSFTVDPTLWGPFRAHAMLNGLNAKDALDGLMRLFLDDPPAMAKLILEKRHGKADNMRTDDDDPGLTEEIKGVLPPEEEA